MGKDFYKTLGVDKQATQEEIKKAYRKMAHKFHPDKKDGDETKFKELNEAYQILSDPSKRQQYDQFGSDGPFSTGGNSHRGEGGFGGFDPGRGGAGFEGINIEDIFDMFGGAFGGQNRAASTKGQNIGIDVSLSILEALNGVRKIVQLKKFGTCKKCVGSGGEDGSITNVCGKCKGQGQVNFASRSIFGTISRIMICDQCEGEGKVINNKCSVCKGSGIDNYVQEVVLDIPSGINDGESLILRGGGHASKRKKLAGDLLITVHIKTDTRFKRSGTDVIYKAKINVTEAMLGAIKWIPTLTGEAELKIPPGTQNGDIIDLVDTSEIGFNNGRQRNIIQVEIPKKLSSRAKKLATELSQNL